MWVVSSRQRCHGDRGQQFSSGWLNCLLLDLVPFLSLYFWKVMLHMLAGLCGISKKWWEISRDWRALSKILCISMNSEAFLSSFAELIPCSELIGSLPSLPCPGSCEDVDVGTYFICKEGWVVVYFTEFLRKLFSARFVCPLGNTSHYCMRWSPQFAARCH